MTHVKFFDVDQANDAIKDTAAPVCMEVTQKDKFHIQGQYTHTGQLIIFEFGSDTGYYVRHNSTLDDFLFGIQRSFNDVVESSQVDHKNVQTTVFLDRKCSDGNFLRPMSSHKGVIVQADTLMNAISAQLGHEPKSRITFREEPMFLPVHLACENICSALQNGLDGHGGLHGSPLAVANLRDALINTILYGARHSYSAALLKGSVELPRIVRKAIEFIHANAHLPIVPTDVAVGCGLSIRSLQLTFRERLETTPQQYIRKVRLQRVYEELKGGSGKSVGDVARKWGFFSPGEFARIYYAEFGEKPGETFRNGYAR